MQYEGIYGESYHVEENGGQTEHITTELGEIIDITYENGSRGYWGHDGIWHTL